jgi:hypothetical protein
MKKPHQRCGFFYRERRFVKTLPTRILLLLVSLSLGLSSCQTDQFLPCEENPLLKGLLCKKIIVQNGKPAGYIQYMYNKDSQVAQENYLDPNEKSQGILYRYYTGKRLDSTYFWSKEEKLNAKLIQLYNASDSLITSTQYNLQNGGFQVERRQFFYSKQLDSVQVFLNGNLQVTKRYFFYNNSELLYKILYYNENNLLDSQSVFSSSNNGFLIERKLDPNGKKVGQITKKTNADGQVIYEEILGINNILLQKTDFILDNSGQLVKKIFTRPNTSLDNFEQFYYH